MLSRLSASRTDFVLFSGKPRPRYFAGVDGHADPLISANVARWESGVIRDHSSTMDADAVQDGGVVATEEASDLGVAVVTIWQVADGGPSLLSGVADAECSARSAELVERDTASAADLGDGLEQLVSGQPGKDVGAHRLRFLPLPSLFFCRQESASTSMTWQW